MLIHDVRELGLRIRDQRLELGLSQVAFAKTIGVSRYWVMQIERGNRGAEIGLVLRALHALGLRLDVRSTGTPDAGATDPESAWPDLSAILDRARGAQP